MTVNVLPRPGVLGGRVIFPAQQAEPDRLEMASPSPEPPYCRVVELSAWLKRVKQPTDRLCGHADAGVGHLDAQERVCDIVAEELGTATVDATPDCQ